MLHEACKILLLKHSYIWHVCLDESYDYLLVHHIKNLVLVFQASKGSTPHYLCGFVQTCSPNFRGLQDISDPQSFSFQSERSSVFLGRSKDLLKCFDL